MKLLARLGVGGLVLFGVWRIGGDAFARWQEGKTSVAWAQTVGALEDVDSRFAAAPPSSAARLLQAHAARIGIDLAASDDPGALRPSPDVKAGFDEIARALTVYVDAQASRADDGNGEPGPELAAAYRRYAPALADLETRILAAGPVTWASDPERLFEAPVPPLRGQRQLQALLLLDALERDRAGDGAGAARALEASWKINAGLRERPELLAQLLTLVIDRHFMGVLRRIRSAHAAWRTRILESDYRRGLADAFRMEAWVMRRYTQEHASSRPFLGVQEPAAAWLAVVVDPLAEPYLRYAGNSHVEHLRLSTLRLQQLDPCATDAARTEAVSPPPRWNLIARHVMPSLTRAWESASALTLDAELTSHVLDPAFRQPAAVVDSTLCAGLQWTSRREPDGRVTIAASRELPRSSLPQRFTMRVD